MSTGSAAYLLITRADIDRAERFVAGRGIWSIPLGRALPVIRTFVSIVAGIIEVPPLLFGVLSLIGTAVWVTVISLIGYGVGSSRRSLAHGIAVAGYAIAVVVVLAVVAFILYRMRDVRRERRASRKVMWLARRRVESELCSRGASSWRMCPRLRARGRCGGVEPLVARRRNSRRGRTAGARAFSQHRAGQRTCRARRDRRILKPSRSSSVPRSAPGGDRHGDQAQVARAGDQHDGAGHDLN